MIIYTIKKSNGKVLKLASEQDDGEDIFESICTFDFNFNILSIDLITGPPDASTVRNLRHQLQMDEIDFGKLCGCGYQRIKRIESAFTQMTTEEYKLLTLNKFM